jgi:hypothetical protein
MRFQAKFFARVSHGDLERVIIFEIDRARLSGGDTGCGLLPVSLVHLSVYAGTDRSFLHKTRCCGRAIGSRSLRTWKLFCVFDHLITPRRLERYSSLILWYGGTPDVPS